MKGQVHKIKRVKKSKYERAEDRKKFLKEQLSGKGRFVFRNHTKGDLMLRKPAADGRKIIPAGEEWEGDDFFVEYVKSHEAILVQTLEDPNVKEENMENKLILDQPSLVTDNGTMEQVVVKTPKLTLEEDSLPHQAQKDILINEDPLDGVEILLD